MVRVLGLGLAVVAAGWVLGTRFAPGTIEHVLPSAGSHGAWYASRAAGLTSYLGLWLGLAGGLAMSSAWLDGHIGRGRLLAIHQTASVAGVLLGLGHGLVLIPDGWTNFGLFDVLVPFGSYYERTLTGVGTVVLYLAAMISFTFWLRRWIGVRTWRRIHFTSALAYVAALWHGLALGSDAREPWVLGMYLVTSFVVIWFFVIRITYTKPARAPQTGAQAA